MGGIFKSKLLHIARNMFTLVNDSCQILECMVFIYKDESAFLAILESIIHLKGFNVYDFGFFPIQMLPYFRSMEAFSHFDFSLYNEIDSSKKRPQNLLVKKKVLILAHKKP